MFNRYTASCVIVLADIYLVGQCGNQIGSRFWDLALREHASVNKGVFDEPLSSFFRNVDTRYSEPVNIAVGSGDGKIKSLRARAVLIDMEEGVVSEVMRGPMRDVFDSQQLLTDVSGSGNNWAVGNRFYGQKFREQIMDIVRKQAEQCDCLQCFFLLHSMGGGTGSGVGTAILDLLKEEYPEIYRFAIAVYPSADDDVITSPYNSVLAMHELTEKADCVLPIENQALVDLVMTINKAAALKSDRSRVTLSSLSHEMKRHSSVTSGHGGISKDEKPFDAMNNIVAHLLLNMTSSSRFEGSLNVDLNEITMNLVPFPRLHYIVSSLSPLYWLADVKLAPRRMDQVFTDAFARDHQLIRADPRHSLYLACALLLRGKVSMSDIRRNIDRLRPSLKFVHWNQHGWKTGLCSVPPVGHLYSLLSLANNTCIKSTFTDIRTGFVKLYRRKAHLHHYTQVDGMELDQFQDSLESLSSLICDYESLDSQRDKQPETPPQLRVA
ncbi:tubulin epsilon chain-like isoform X2 [Corticium candelabrum]|uniref:tubulin epsilon chain-like isoform X2 n=1 Tax=Corticium candelabrum TaxID=121492 RepID=UPI002E255EC9|nr:tubulin epsilon chain-like isoform X2 [Corticium candelabrum]